MFYGDKMKKPWLVGLTGGIGSGKSAVAARFAGHGVHVVDADDAARWVVEPGEPGLGGLVALLGEGILQPDGRLDRGVLRNMIFADPDLRKQVEQLLHPLIRQAIDVNLANALSEYAVLVSPLLIEGGQYKRVQRVLVVDVPQALQLQRVMQRDAVEEARARAILQAQLPRDERLRYADDVIGNDGSLAALDVRVAELHRQYLQKVRGEV